jgi:hypothetical protein
MDLFWPGVLLVEHKSRGKILDDALDQAIGYLHHLPERDLPQLVVVCDFARFRVRRLAAGETMEFELPHLHKHVKLFESPRVLRRLQTLRRWSHEQEIKSFFTRNARTRCSHGAGTPGRVPIPVGCH